MMILAILVGAISGAGLMFFFDPRMGNRRRSLLRDQFVRASNRASDAVEVLSEEGQNRAQGTVAEARARLSSEPVSDATLVERVRAEMGRYVSHPGAVNVTAHNGVIALSGAILANEVVLFIGAVKRVPGVQRVENRLQVHETPGNIPDLQGGVPRTESRP